MMKRRLVCVAALSAFVLANAFAAQGAQITGRVDVQGPPRSLMALHVTLRKITSRGATPTQEVLRTQPGADGRFAFTQVQPDWYVIEVDGPGVLSMQWGATGPELAGRALVLRSGDNPRGLRIPVVARPVLCGRVFGADGKPAAGIAVSAWRTRKGLGISMSGGGANGVSDGGNTVADDHGRYRFASFNPGDYIVGAYTPDQPDGSPSADAVMGFWKDTLDIDRATWIELSARGEADRCPYDIRLRSVPKDDGPRYHVEGALVSGLATISVRNQEWELWPIPPRPDSPPAIPFDPGRPVFSFDGVPPGKYRLMLGPPLPSSFSGPCFPFRRIDVDQEIVVAADMSGIRVSTQPVAWIKGEVEEVHTAQDARGWSYPERTNAVTLSIRNRCVGAAPVAHDGSFEFHNLDSGAADIDFKVAVEGSYTSRFILNGESSPDPVLHLQPGENDLKIVERFDSGQVDAAIDARSVDGLRERNQQGVWVGDDEHVLLLDEKGRAFRTNFASPNGELKAYLPPGRYTAVAGMNEQLVWGWALMNWDDARVYRAVAALGTAFVVEPGTTTTVKLRDRTVEIQDMMAELGLPMNSR